MSRLNVIYKTCLRAASCTPSAQHVTRSGRCSQVLNYGSAARSFSTIKNQSLQDIEFSVGSPATFLGIQYLQNDEILQLLENIQMLIGTRHPIVNIATSTLLTSKGTFKLQGIITLLLSQILNKTSTNTSHNLLESGILPKQRKLVEVCEMISTAMLLHDHLITVDSLPAHEHKDMKYGNKLSLLFGDYFLSAACSQLSYMENPEVVDTVSQAIAHGVEGRFWLETIDPLQPPTLDALGQYTALKYGALLSSSCHSVALLAGSGSVDLKDSVRVFGTNIGQAIQLRRELVAIEVGEWSPNILYSYPYIAAVCNTNDNNFLHCVNKAGGVSGAEMKHFIESSEGVRAAKEKCSQHCALCVKILETLPQGTATEGLRTIVNSVAIGSAVIL